MSGHARRKGNVRPLGAVRQPIQSPFDKGGRLPAFNLKNNNISHHYEITGNAMQVPPPKEEKEKEEPPKPVKPAVIKSGKSDSGSSTKSQTQDNSADKKELSEAKIEQKTGWMPGQPPSFSAAGRDPICLHNRAQDKGKIKDLKQQIQALEKEIEELKEQLTAKDKSIDELTQEFQQQVNHWKELYEKEKADHEVTKTSLTEAQQEIEELKAKIQQLMTEHEAKIHQLQQEFDKKLADVVEQKDKELAERDVKLNRLKQQMADSLKGNSWERQQQLEELTKELGRIQDEADSLRMKLKQFKSSKSCGNCQDMAAKLEKAVVSMKEKDASIKELKSLCSKFESQLTKQDEILKLMAEKKGHKVTNFPK